MADGSRRAWHRLFGIGLTDLFTGSRWRVELEKELALRSQLLDVVVIECDVTAPDPPPTLPDGLDNLRPHNLLTYKSQHEALDGWAIDELIGHYVNYRKLKLARDQRPGGNSREEGSAAARQDPLLPERDFQLYAVATRAPQRLQREALCASTTWDGIYDLRWGLRNIRLIVLGQVAKHPRNAPWQLFSADIERIRHGARHYDPHSREAEALLYELYLRYKLELPNMTYTLADFARESREHILADLTPEERLRGLPTEERLRGLPPEERLRGLPPEEVVRSLSPEGRHRLKELLDREED